MVKRNLPTAPVLPLELWQQLYQAATDFQLLAPWQWVFVITNQAFPIVRMPQ